MHELPKDLTNSLRSWRGSVYGNSERPQGSEADLEKGLEDYGDKPGALSPAESSVVLHPSASSRSLRQILRLGRSPQTQQRQQQQQQTQEPPKTPKAQQQGQQLGLNTSSPKAVTKRQATFQQVPQTPASQALSIFHHAPRISDPDPAADRLDDDMTPLSKEHFYELIGMRAPEHTGQLPKELAMKHGLYGKIRGHMRYIQIKYRVFDIFTYLFLALQLLLSAVFIVLGSVNGNYNIAIAVLGAVSAVIAGLLALMKGQGLPNRLRQVRDDLTNVLFEAEELYWDVMADRPVLFKDIKRIREDYLRVLQAARKNHPDSWTGAANSVAKAVDSKAAATRATTATR